MGERDDLRKQRNTFTLKQTISLLLIRTEIWQQEMNRHILRNWKGWVTNENNQRWGSVLHAWVSPVSWLHTKKVLSKCVNSLMNPCSSWWNYIIVLLLRLFFSASLVPFLHLLCSKDQSHENEVILFNLETTDKFPILSEDHFPLCEWGK